MESPKNCFQLPSEVQKPQKLGQQKGKLLAIGTPRGHLLSYLESQK